MKKAVLLLFAYAFINNINGQGTKAETQQDAMQHLRWLTGTWRGTSELIVAGKKQITYIQETIKPVLDGTIFTVSAIGKAADTSTQKLTLVYNSFGVISYDVQNRQYRWKTWRNPGNTYDENTFKVGDHSFEYIAGENGGYMRYKATLNEQSQWIETGEFSKDNATWRLFITMKLFKR